MSTKRMTYKFLPSTVRKIFSCSLVTTRMTCSALVNRQPSCSLALKQFQLHENSVKSFQRRLLHTTTSNWQENRNQPSATQLPCLMNNPTHIIWWITVSNNTMYMLCLPVFMSLWHLFILQAKLLQKLQRYDAIYFDY